VVLSENDSEYLGMPISDFIEKIVLDNIVYICYHFIVNKCILIGEGGKMKERDRIGLSNAEWRIMDFLWDKNPVTIADMVRHFDGITNWDRHVIIMMLKRMEAKGAVEWRTIGRAKHYFPVIEREQSCVQETKDFLERVYKGSLGLMLTTMVKQEKFGKGELEELRRILNEGEQDD